MYFGKVNFVCKVYNKMNHLFNRYLLKPQKYTFTILGAEKTEIRSENAAGRNCST